jgi:beta-glucosidase
LVGFQKVALAAGASAVVDFRIPSDLFRQIDAGGQAVWARGRYGLVIGSASPGRRALDLGAPAPAQGEITAV